MKQLSNSYARGRVSAVRTRKWLSLALCAGFVIVSTGCAKLQSRDEMNKGVQSYKNGKYADAAQHFKQAVRLDPTNQNAELYLATSYFTQWVPGAQSADNKKNLEMARQTFQQVLDKDPDNSLALATMAAMSFNEATAKSNPDEKAAALEGTKKWNERRIKADPKDAEAYYYLGVIDWLQADPAIKTARVQEKADSEKKKPRGRAKLTTPDENAPIEPDNVRNELKDKYGKLVEDGIANLHKALDINNENEDAMSYLNLLLRTKAALDDSTEQAKADIAKANDWFNKSLETKRIKATRPKKTEES
jgi:tetratricopeptide (TPR) repeat protein